MEFQPNPKGARDFGSGILADSQAEMVKSLCVLGTQCCPDFISLRSVLLSAHSYLYIQTNHVSSVTTPWLTSVLVLAPLSQLSLSSVLISAQMCHPHTEEVTTACFPSDSSLLLPDLLTGH